MRTSLSLLVALAACGSKDPGKEAPSAAGPMPIAFGDCAGPTVAFVSGPRPLPFTLEEAAGVWTEPKLAKAATDDDPPPPPETDDASGGTGTAMALDEGKMGKRDSDRAEGQYRMKTTDDPQLARQQAIEQARAAGILGKAEPGQSGAFASLTGTGDISSDDGNIYGGLLGNEAGEMNGGFGYGRNGFGPGGTGTGWGTIGTGRYGTIGHGTGTGYGVAGGGHGGMRHSAVPSVSIGQPNAQGDLDKAIIRRYIKRNINKIQYCYEKQLLATPTLQGTVSASFFIGPTGNVVSATASGVHPEVASCVAAVIKSIEFPKPKGGGGVQVNYPFTFRLAGDSAAPAPTPPPATPPPPAPAPPAPVAAPGSQRELFRSPAHALAMPAGYTPGAANPLRAETAALTACFRATAKHRGAIVVALAYDGAGAVTTATVHGLDDAAANDCVAAAARKLKRAPDGPAAQRCPVAFGETPLAELAAIDVGTTIKLDGKDRADTELANAVTARLAPALALSGPVLVAHPPLVLRPADSTPLAKLVDVMRSVVRGGDDFVLAAKRGAAWKLLLPMTIPTVPVPFGTGTTWNRLKTRGRGLSAVDDERVVLSLLVGKDQKIWIGISRVNEFQEIAAGPDQAGKLAAVLKDHKQSAFFMDRTDVEIAGDDDATYGDLVPLIDAATAAGFSDWQVTSAAGLAARPETR